MLYRLRYLSSFYRDLNGAAQYISEELDAPLAAHRLVNDIEAALRKIAETPRLGRPYITEAGEQTIYRKLLVRRYYIIYVSNEENKTVEVHHLVHSRRNLALILEQAISCACSQKYLLFAA